MGQPSEALLPAVGGAVCGDVEGSPRKSDGDYPSNPNGDADYGDYYFDEKGEDGGDDGGSDHGGGYFSMSSLPSSMSFKSLPSYMRAKSGVGMDSDRVGGWLGGELVSLFRGNLLSSVSCTSPRALRC